MERMDFVQFQEYVKEQFLNRLSKNEKENVTISIIPTRKTNCVYAGFIAKPDNKSFAPTIYLDNFYEDYVSGEILDSIIDRIYKLWKNNIDGPDGMEIDAFIKKFQNFNCIKDNIIANVINVKRNEEFLATVPHKIFEDLAIIYKVIVDEHSKEFATVTIQNQHLGYWDIETEDIVNVLHELAMENTKRLLPCKSCTMIEVVAEMMDISVEEAKEMMPKDPMNEMYILSNRMKTHGAITMFFEDVLSEISEKLGSNLYIMPSSIHEVIIVESDLHDPEGLNRLVSDVNDTTLGPEEYLSGSVYYFDAKTKELSVAVAGK